MQTQTPRALRLLPAAVLILASVLAAMAIWRTFGGSVPLEPKGYRVTAVLPSASNLHPQADVRVAGVNIGRVTDVQRDGSHARAELEIESRYAPLRADTRAILRNKTLLGEAYLELSPGSKNAPIVRDGGALPAKNVLPSQRLDDVLQTFDAPTRQRVRVLFGGLARAFGGRSANLNETLGRLAPASEDLTTVVGELARQSGDLRQLLADSGDVFATLGRQQGAIRTAITSGNRVLRTTATQREGLSRTIRALPPFLRSMRSSFTRLDAASGDLNAAVTALRPLVPELSPAVRAIDEHAPTFEQLFRRLPPVEAAAKRGLPSLTRVLDAASPALSEIYPASREVIPVLQLLAVVKDSVTTTLANVGQIHGGYAVGPGNVITNYVPGVITAWNETIGGWIKRLPTHRGNAYPKPGFLDQIGRYPSFDCRHTGNVLYVPALGQAPPCVTQGPWTFNGKTAYFPRLQPAPK